MPDNMQAKSYKYARKFKLFTLQIFTIKNIDIGSYI